MKAEFIPDDGGEPVDLGEVSINHYATALIKKYQIISPLETISPELEFKLMAAMDKKLKEHCDEQARKLCWDHIEAEGWRELRAIRFD